MMAVEDASESVPLSSSNPPPLQQQYQAPPPVAQYAAPQQFQGQPVYTLLPNGQVQVTLTLPAGTVVPQQAQLQRAPYYAAYPAARPAQPAYQYPQPNYGGVPQYQYPHMQQSSPICPVAPRVPSDNLAIANLVTYIIGLFTFVPYLASIILSFVMVHRGYFQTAGRKATVLTFAIMELLAWLFCVSFSWFFTTDCVDYYSYYYPYGYYNTSCTTYYWGWISIVVWGGLAILIGIARVVLCWKAAKQYQHSKYYAVPM